MSAHPSHAFSPSGDTSKAHARSPPTHPDLSSRISDPSIKETEPSVETEQPPTISPSYDPARNEQGCPTSGTDNVEPDENISEQSFQPFFTILADAHSPVIHHPTVHYIFSDDDTDIIKEAGFRSLHMQRITIPSIEKDSELEDDHEGSTEHDPEEEEKPALPPAIPGVRTHYLLLDVKPFATAVERNTSAVQNMSTFPSVPSASPSNPVSALPKPDQPAGLHTRAQYRVNSAKSFSPTWQILNAELVPAPTFDYQDNSDAQSHGMMLNIRGTSGAPQEQRNKEEGLEDLMDRFESQMAELQAVIDLAKVEENPRDGQADEIPAMTTAAENN
ncbi:hypothetical protein N7532_002257 [Penicillium argentinense]|uniref:Uncharacterized protein n=1 Tax=Penicillium argentinense TaxID=1131581 RepID=A0A9W9G1M3_9EURO|nr:uncharacterized protein N7532_002257 [Penicillium argentinense]KAJ5109612.1 hypothetical protein N7532_002257 [Penicillium argentinense]